MTSSGWHLARHSSHQKKWWKSWSYVAFSFFLWLANVLVRCNGTFNLLCDYLNDLQFRDLFSDHVRCFNAIRNWTLYCTWTHAAPTRLSYHKFNFVWDQTPYSYLHTRKEWQIMKTPRIPIYYGIWLCIVLGHTSLTCIGTRERDWVHWVPVERLWATKDEETFCSLIVVTKHAHAI